MLYYGVKFGSARMLSLWRLLAVEHVNSVDGSPYVSGDLKLEDFCCQGTGPFLPVHRLGSTRSSDWK
jgi:hypothetical protein